MTRLKPALWTALTFLLVGPLFGLLGFAVLAYGFAGASAEDGPVGLAFLWMTPFAYLFGAIPAVLTGLVTGALLSPRRAVVYVIGAAVIGAAVTALVTLLDGPGDDEGLRNLILIGALAGLGSGLVSLFLARRRTSTAP
ncbi:hypothetical protein Q0812_10750 [Brevundimonas sp. 2R-24]|uniref:Uncharacterized protein n=1 Tax=Peiella sedimenti TaxID=3061083 RepID=A0ABT8SMV4_9CAUL|nr:hypothetical protein [Caulobacteraceae bacterium XZ-24]